MLFEIVNFVKNETLTLWILSKRRFSKCEFSDKLRILPQCGLDLKNSYFENLRFSYYRCTHTFWEGFAWSQECLCNRYFSPKSSSRRFFECSMKPHWSELRSFETKPGQFEVTAFSNFRKISTLFIYIFWQKFLSQQSAFWTTDRKRSASIFKTFQIKHLVSIFISLKIEIFEIIR